MRDPVPNRRAAVPEDPDLPWLATALDQTAMSEHFTRTVLPAFHPSHPQRFALQACDIDHVRYRPGRNCAIAYRLRVLDTRTSQCHDLRFHGRMYPPSAAASRHAKASQQPLEQPPLGPPLHLIAPLDMVLWAFPNERKLAGLGAVLDQNRLEQDVLPEVITQRWGHGWQLLRCHRDVVHYVPEHTLTLRVQMTLRQQQTGERRPVVVYAKCYYNDQGALTLNTMVRLNALRSAGLCTPAAICYQPEYRRLWQEAMPGVPLADLLHDSFAAPALMRQAGEQVAALHRAPIQTDEKVTFKKLVSRLDAVETLLARQMGHQAPLIHDLAARLRATVPADTFQPVLLHGDLHAKNFLVGSGGAGLIDLDNCVNGPAVWDLGSFIAALLCGSRAEAHGCGRVAGHVEWFLSGYGPAASNCAQFQGLDWCVACALVIERAYRSVSRLKAGRISALPALLVQAERILEEGWRQVLS